jgi:site-specific recombinase XerD
MGHEDISTTMRYVHLGKSDLAEGVDDFSPR